MTDKPMELPPEGEKVLAWWDLGENEAPMLLRHFAASGWEQWDYESCCWERGPAQPPTRWVPLSLVRMAREIAEAGWKIVALDSVGTGERLRPRFLLHDRSEWLWLLAVDRGRRRVSQDARRSVRGSACAGSSHA